MTPAARLDPLEIASGYVFGRQDDLGEPPRPPRDASPRAELERGVATALARPPCLVAFSGGRDSSAILALAAAVARRDGLPPPIPFTCVFPGVPNAEESEWQELVVRHLELDDWIRREIDDELDGVGPVATRALTRHGLYWPPNAHFFVPALEAAGSGSVLTGGGGDQLLHPGRHARTAAVLALRSGPRPRDALRLALAAAPRAVRARVRLRRDPPATACPWLRPEAMAAVLEAAARDAAAEPIRRRAWARWTWRSRALQEGVRIMRLLAGDTGAELIHPFLTPGFASAWGEFTSRNPPRDRTSAVAALVGDVLPASVCERRTKASFGRTFWNRHAEAFATSLGASDLDSELVDGAKIVEFWSRAHENEVPVFRSLTLLQHTWLTRGRPSADEAQQRGDGALGSGPVGRPAELEAR